MKVVDPKNSFKHIICQEEGCTRIAHENENIDDYFKDLNLMNRDLSRAVYIDSKPFQFWSHPDNGVAVEEYMGDGTRDDKELLNLIEFLEEIKNENDVRDVLTEKFGIRAALEESKML